MAKRKVTDKDDKCIWKNQCVVNLHISFIFTKLEQKTILNIKFLKDIEFL